MQSEGILLIPTLNERKNLEKLIPLIFELMPEISVLIIDDSSSDGTDTLISNLASHYPRLNFLRRQDNFGYGKACIDGFRWAIEGPYKYVLTMDADFSHDYKAIPMILNNLDQYEVVIGSRYVHGGKVENWKLFRKILSRFANFYVRLILKVSVKDMTTGFNAYRKSILEKLNFNNIKSDGYAFLVELKYKLIETGAKVVELPIVFSERREGKSKISGKIIWESIKLPWKLLKS